MAILRSVSNSRFSVLKSFGFSLNWATSSADLITVSSSTSLSISGKYTVCWWCKQKSIGSVAGRIIETSNGGMLWTGTNAMQVTHNGSSKTSGNNLFDTNTWTHIGVTFDNSKISFYKNGALHGTVSQTTAPAYSGIWYLGNRADGIRVVDGNMTDLLVYKGECLNEDEIAGLYQGAPVSSTSLSAYWKMNEGSGSTIYDQSSYGNNGTITGCTYSIDVPY